jgi:predicted PurR-regulated permease PerM
MRIVSMLPAQQTRPSHRGSVSTRNWVTPVNRCDFHVSAMELCGCDWIVERYSPASRAPRRRGITGESQLRVLPNERAQSSERVRRSNEAGGKSHSESKTDHPKTDHPPPGIRRMEIVIFVLVALLLITVVAVLFLAKAFFLPVMAAFIVGTMLSPAAGFLEGYRIPRSLAAVLIVTAVGAGGAFIVGLISSPLMQWSSRLPELGAILKDKLHVFDRPLALWQELQTMLGSSDSSSTAAFQMPKFDWVQPTLEFLSPTFTEFLLFFATLVLFIASWRDLRRGLIMTFAGREARLRTLRILNEIEGRLGGYLMTVTMINLGVGAATGIVCAITGMPNPAGLGALAATLNFFPIIGPVAMFAILSVVGVVAFSTISGGLIAPLAFIGITFLEGHFVTPTIIGRRLQLNALAVFIALAFWTWLWGPMGGFLSSPLLIVALILRDHLWSVDQPQLPSD